MSVSPIKKFWFALVKLFRARHKATHVLKMWKTDPSLPYLYRKSWMSTRNTRIIFTNDSSNEAKLAALKFLYVPLSSSLGEICWHILRASYNSIFNSGIAGPNWSCQSRQLIRKFDGHVMWRLYCSTITLNAW